MKAFAATLMLDEGLNAGAGALVVGAFSWYCWYDAVCLFGTLYC